MNYEVQLLEYPILTDKGFIVKPDVIKISRQNKHVLLFECKSGEIDEHQINRYKTMNCKNLIDSLRLEEDMQYEFCILTIRDHPTLNTDFPMLVFNRDYIHKENSFRLFQLDEIFKNDVDISTDIPTLSYYPFSTYDSDKTILIKLLQGIVSLSVKKMRNKSINLYEILESDDTLSSLHPYWRFFSDEHKKEMKARMRNLLNRYIKNNIKMSKFLDKRHDGKYHITPQFTEECYDLLNQLEDNANLDSFNEDR